MVEEPRVDVTALLVSNWLINLTRRPSIPRPIRFWNLTSPEDFGKDCLQPVYGNVTCMLKMCRRYTIWTW
ncbi:hypothetical protein ACLKA6_008122 [Drosophila palustris]